MDAIGESVSMESNFTYRARERFLDLRDWIEIRPDPHFWPLAVLPLAVIGATYLLPRVLLEIVIMLAVGAVVIAIPILIASAIGWVAIRAIADVAKVSAAQQRNRTAGGGWASGKAAAG